MKNIIYMQSAQALGTKLELQIAAPDKSSAEKLFIILWQKVENFQNKFSRFLTTSELTIFNSKAGKKVKVSKEFHDILKKTKELAIASDGLFNPFILPSLNRVGYITSFSSGGERLSTIDYSTRVLESSSKLEIGKDWAKIPSNTAIDLGGIGKGYLADKLADTLDFMAMPEYCLSIGGDIIAKSSKTNKQKIKIQSLVDPDRTVGQYISVDDKFAVATSGLSRHKNNKTQYHLIDPRTGNLAKSKYQMCSVAASDTTTADVMASCVLIGGENFAKKILSKSIVKGILLQSKNERNGVMLMGSGFRISRTYKNIAKINEVEHA